MEDTKRELRTHKLETETQKGKQEPRNVTKCKIEKQTRKEHQNWNMEKHNKKASYTKQLKLQNGNRKQNMQIFNIYLGYEITSFALFRRYHLDSNHKISPTKNGFMGGQMGPMGPMGGPTYSAGKNGVGQTKKHQEGVAVGVLLFLHVLLFVQK